MNTLNWNAEEKRETSNAGFLDVEAEGLFVKIISIKDAQKTKPAVRITYKILAGAHVDKAISQIYYTTDASMWRLRPVAIACGFSETDIDESGVEKIHVKKDLELSELIGKELMIDACGEEYNQKITLKVKNERASF